MLNTVIEYHKKNRKKGFVTGMFFDMAVMIVIIFIVEFSLNTISGPNFRADWFVIPSYVILLIAYLWLYFDRKKDFLIIYNDLSKAELIYKDITSKYKASIYFYKFDQNFKRLSEFCTKKETFMKKEICIDFVYHTYKRHLGNRSHAELRNWSGCRFISRYFSGGEGFR